MHAEAPGGTLYNLFYSGMRGEEAQLTSSWPAATTTDKLALSEMVIDHPTSVCCF